MLPKVLNPENIVAMCLSPTSPNLVWVASSSGRLWSIDWTTGAGNDAPIQLKCTLLTGLTVESIVIKKIARDVPFVSVLADNTVDNVWYIWACDIRDKTFKNKTNLMAHTEPIENLRSLGNGQALAASSRNDTLLGSLNSTSLAAFDQLSYEFFILDCSDEITCLDIRGTDRIHLNKKSQAETGDEIVLDIVVGCARGAIYFYNDLLPQLRWLQSNKKKYSLQPRKYHWHRKAVHAVKWSQDGEFKTLAPF
jgi:NET1-associated nuclear protein 1 (U3 small nucleolar RNA-associated protein 17)